MLEDVVKDAIQTAYRDFLSGKGIRARYGQRLMVAEIARYLGDITQADGARTSAHGACVVEAGTGTGKTLAYLLATIPVAKALGKRLVISTATVALQDQIVGKDLPDVRAHTKLDFNWTLAKGRGRYLCLSRLEGRLQDEGVGNSESMPLFLLEDAPDGGDARAFYEKMLASYASQKWDGDRDHWPETIEDDRWRRITTDHRGCTNRHCAYFDSCAFFSARSALDEADVIVANHDLILADLALGGGAILPKPEDTIYIFDEAHHLPEKALSHFAASAGLNGARSWLKQLSQILVQLSPFLPAGTQAARAIDRISAAARNQDPLLENLYTWLSTQLKWEKANDGRAQLHRFPEGQLPDDFAEQVQALLPESALVCRELDGLADVLNRGLGDRPDNEVDKATAESWYPVVGQLHARSEEQVELWRSFAAELAEQQGPPPARWVQLQQWERGEELTLYTSPVLADGLLASRLWSRCFGAILTSATLTALGRFDRLNQRAGLPSASRFLVAPPAFRYQEMATVEVPADAMEPGDSASYTEALVKALPKLWADEKAVLVLFTARRQMHAVRDALPADIAVDVSTQDDHARGIVLQNHRDRVDAGKRSVLFGVASFAEGIDLPGSYLEHVIITRLPFSVPDDPIEASLAEWITQRGGNPFMEISVPDASIRLVQAAGRLLRTEDDRGRITILDRRILTRRYGSLLLDALPPFRRVFS